MKSFFETVFNGGHPLAVQPMSYDHLRQLHRLRVPDAVSSAAMIADRWLGQRYSVIDGGVIMAIGEFALMSPPLLFVGLALLIIGNGFFKPEHLDAGRQSLQPGDARIDRAYSIFYVGIQCRRVLLAADLRQPRRGSAFGYKWGFFAAGIGMVIGLLIYMIALRTLPKDRIARLQNKTEEKKPLTGPGLESGHRAYPAVLPHHAVLGRLRAAGATRSACGPSSSPTVT